MRSIGEFLNLLEKSKRQRDGSYLACCPSHPDNNPSLHITLADNKLLLKCLAGCTTESIVASMNLTMPDLFIDELPLPKPIKTVPSKEVCSYDYLDEQCNLLFQVVRYEPKDFRPRHKNGSGEWVYNMDGVRRVLYHLDLITITKDSDLPIYLVEGEKDADNLLDTVNRITTTSPGGANNWRTEYADYLINRDVIIIPDNDAPGMEYARQAALSLQDKAKSIKVVLLPSGKDVSDWLATGNSPDALINMTQDVSILFEEERPNYRTSDDCTLWDKRINGHNMQFRAEKLSDERSGIHSRITICNDGRILSWSHLNIEKSEDRTRLANASHTQIKSDLKEKYSKDDLRADLDRFSAGLWDYHLRTFVPELSGGTTEDVPVVFLLHPFIIQGGGTILFAPPGRGKSFTALLWAISADAGCSKIWQAKQAATLFINLERSRESVVRRIGMCNEILGLPRTRPMLVLNARGKSLQEVLPVCRKAIKQNGVKFVVLDSISRAGYGDLNENQPVNRIVDALASLCPSWLALAHTSRANEEHAYGSIMLDAGADVCVQLSSQINDDGTLGVGYMITKQNDLPKIPQSVYAFEFGEKGLSKVRIAKNYEFPEIEGKRKEDMMTTLIEFISGLDTGDATATQIEKALGYNRSNISTILSKSGRFIQTRRDKTSVYYGVKDLS